MKPSPIYARPPRIRLTPRPIYKVCRITLSTRLGAIATRCLSSGFPQGGRVRRTGEKPAVTTLLLDDLPQGLLGTDPLPPLLDEGEAAQKYPTVVREARANMKKFDNCVLLTKVGGFYELYCEHADEFGPLLGLRVGTKKTSAGPVSMAGFPFFQLERFLKILVQDLNRHVAISEETRIEGQVKAGEPQYTRKVERIITPGTLIDEDFLSPYDHNYLLAVSIAKASDAVQEPVHIKAREELEDTAIKNLKVGLAWVDLSSGDFFVQSDGVSSLASNVARINPKEILLPKNATDSHHEVWREILTDGRHLISSYEFPEQTVLAPRWEDVVEDESVSKDVQDYSAEENKAATMLLHYVQKLLPGLRLRLQAPKRRSMGQFMNIDKNSLRALEIHQTLRHNTFKGSVLQAIRRTKTESGARLLSRRLTSPSTSLDEIRERLDLVEFFRSQLDLLDDVTDMLTGVSDTLRILQKFAFSRGDADDLLELAETITLTKDICELLSGVQGAPVPCVSRILRQFQWDVPQAIASRIQGAIDRERLRQKQRSQEESEVAKAAEMARTVLDREAPNEPEDRLSKRLKSYKAPGAVLFGDEERTQVEDIWIMKKNSSKSLGKAHRKLEMLQQKRTDLGESLRQRTGATSLVLKWSPGLGHVCHVKGKDMSIDMASLDDARPVRSSKSTKSFYLPEWSSLGMEIESAKARIRAEEQKIFESLRDSIIEGLVTLRRNANILDEIDVACSFARLAEEFNLTRPAMNASLQHKVIGGRHLAVERGLTESGKHFTPNHCLLEGSERMWLITGPNMAGKSTFLRQNALISILAQTGSFVPAEYAELGIVDQVFSRVGSADDVSQDQSTFMVEMLETAYILRHATERSFVIMDEIGRGTTPEDGIAVGFGVLHHLHNVVRCRTLFATHFHALADMTRDFAMLATYCTDIAEDADGAFRYDHRVVRGVNREPHALKVARLAGIPDEALAIAGEVLTQLKPVATDQPTVRNSALPSQRLAQTKSG